MVGIDRVRRRLAVGDDGDNGMVWYRKRMRIQALPGGFRRAFRYHGVTMVLARRVGYQDQTSALGHG